MAVQEFTNSKLQYVINHNEELKIIIPESIPLQRYITHFSYVMDFLVSDDKNNLAHHLTSFVRSGCHDTKSSTTKKEAYLKDILRGISTSIKSLEKFLKDKKSDGSRVALLWKRSADVAGCRKSISAQSDIILSGLNQLFQLGHIPPENAKLPDISKFEKDLPKEAYNFWRKSVGDKLTGDWSTFEKIYTQLFANFQPMDLDYTQKLLCANDESKKITIYGFLQVVRKHGFPFESMMSANAESAIKPTSEEARAEIAKMVIPLVTEFSDAEVQGHLVTIYGWYKGIKRDDDQGHQARGEEWARLIKEARQVSTKTEAHLQAEKVDAARRAISFFYQRFMMVWRIGPISRDMFATASFPGKPRIKDFLRYVQPLDRANLTVVIGKQDIDWSVKKPEIYHFLEKLI